MISPRRPSASVRPFSCSAFTAYSIVIRHTASTARDTCVCCALCGEPGDRAARSGPATLGGEIAGADCVNGVARSPRTSRRRISRILSVSAMWVRTNRWRSVCSPTVEFAAQPSSTVQIVGACIRFRQKTKLLRGDNIGKSLPDPDQQLQSYFPSHQPRLQPTKSSVRTCFSATPEHHLTSPILARIRGVPYPSAQAMSPRREYLPLRKGGLWGPIPPWVKECRVKSTTLLLRISSRSAVTRSQFTGVVVK
jgi:hypothetical protein